MQALTSLIFLVIFLNASNTECKMTTSGSFFTFLRPTFRRIEHNVKEKGYFNRKEILRQKTKSSRRIERMTLKLFFKNRLEQNLKRNGQESIVM